jgi:hypothetical protein
MSELSQTIQRRPAPLPMPYRPMADVISPGRRVMLSTDHASRKALRSVGKVAATTDHIIHLDPVPIAPHRLDEVIAHELTHVAHPSPTPRFFDDVDDSPEERRAEEVAKIMTSSPIAPGTARPQPGVQRRSGTPAETIRRSPATSSGSPGSTVSAASLAARVTGAAPSPSSAPAVQRRATAPSSDGGIGTEAIASGAGSISGAEVKAYLESNAGAAWFEKMLQTNMSGVVAMLEDRMIVEAERRGGRTWRTS